MYFLDDPNLMFRKNESNTQEFTKYTKKINKKLERFLKKNLPKNIYEAIFSNQTEFKNNNEDTKTVTEIPKVKTTCKTIYKDNLYWAGVSSNLDTWASRAKKKEKYTALRKVASDIIRAYEKCGCSKCKEELKDGNLKTVETFIKESE